jgi:hypothetical protein
MPTMTMTFLFDTARMCSESWTLHEHHAQPLQARVLRIAQDRLPLLASCVRIVRLQAPGMASQRVSMRGMGGAFAHPRDAVKFIASGRTLPVFHLRGVPREVFHREQLTPAGRIALAKYSKALEECGAFIHRFGEDRAIRDLETMGWTLYSYRKDRKATLRQLRSILRAEEAQRFWDELKAREKALAAARP